MTAPSEAVSRLRRGAVELVSEGELVKKLALGRPLRVKLGVDPTSPDLHLGHTVVLQKLRLFQDLGHTAVLIIGDFTSRVGDPSGRDSTRPTLTKEAVESNAATYKEQAFKVLDPARTEVRHNAEWLEPFMERRLLSTLQRHTVQQILARDDFQKRMAANSPITMLELLYPLLQGYDSVAVQADVELGGTDQLFNLLMGREMQKDAGQEPQVVLTTPLIVGLDGQKKMSKSYGNAIGLTEPPREMFGKLMRVSDEAMWMYWELLTEEDLPALRALHPMECKKRLAQAITARYHGEPAATAEREFFENTFSRREVPVEGVETVALPADGATWSAFLASIGAAKSRKEAQRLLTQGAVKANDQKLQEEPVAESVKRLFPAESAVSLKVGKHRFYSLKLKP